MSLEQQAGLRELSEMEIIKGEKENTSAIKKKKRIVKSKSSSLQ